MTTREPSEHMGRITTVMESGDFFETSGFETIELAKFILMKIG